MENVEIERRLTDFIQRELVSDANLKVDRTTKLLETGIIESLTLVSLVAFIQKTFEIRIDDQDLRLENFRDVPSISALVTRLKTVN